MNFQLNRLFTSRFSNQLFIKITPSILFLVFVVVFLRSIFERNVYGENSGDSQPERRSRKNNNRRKLGRFSGGAGKENFTDRCRPAGQCNLRFGAGSGGSGKRHL